MGSVLGPLMIFVKLTYDSHCLGQYATVVSGQLERRCRMIYACVPSWFDLGLEDGRVPTSVFYCISTNYSNTLKSTLSDTAPRDSL